jgi:class 3 adenylate cyclase
VTTFGLSREQGTALVGRRQELAWLHGRLELAGGGYGHLVLVEGHAGVGKTRLALALLDEARAAGALVVRGRCYEHLDLAYLPLREGLFATLAQRLSQRPDRGADLELLRLDTGIDEGETGRPKRPLDEERTRQMLALTRLVIELAHDRFLVLFVDDIDWADGATIDLLRHLLFRLDDEDVPLLTVLTSRDDPAARGAAGIARLRSDPRAATLRLHALTPLEATELARQARPGLGLEQARHLASAAGGNPLLVEALARQGNTAWLAATTSTGRPLAAAIDAALGRLDETTKAPVRAAAFLVPDCTRDLLGEVSGLDPAALERAITEAVDAGVLVDDHGRLAFVHPLYPHTLQTQVGPASRRKLHARIATILLARREAGEDVTTRGVAHHLVEAGAAADPNIVFENTRRAGDEAMAVAAWEEAARCYEAAISAVPTDLGVDEAVALYRLAGLCHRAELDLARALDRFQAAIAVLGPDGDPATLADLHIWRIRCTASQDLLDVARERGLLEALVDEVEDRRPDLAAEGLVELATSYWLLGEPDRAEAAARRAIAIADRYGDHESYALATTQLCIPLWERYDLRESLATLEDGVTHAKAAGGSSILAGGPMFRVPLVLTWLGRFDDAVTRADECRALIERVPYLEENLPLAALTQVAVARGEFDEAEQHAHQALLLQRLFGYHWASGLFLPALMTAHVARGRWAGARAALATWEETADAMQHATIRLLSRYVDACERGYAAEGRALPRLPRAPSLGLDMWAAAAVEVARREGAASNLERAYDVLGDVAARGGVVTSGLAMLVPRLLGVAADLLGDEAAAVDHLHEAIAVAERLGAEPELARARVDLATILLRRNERHAALDQIDRATEVFERLAMIPDCAHANALAGGQTVRTASHDRHATTESVVIFFSDVVDSTRHTEELGATRYRTRARQVEELVMSAIAAHGGSVVTGINLGDGFIGLFPSPTRAIAAARRCAADVGATGLHLHLAVHRGDVIVDGARIYGGPVNYAARLSDLAGPDEILVSEIVRERLGGLEGVAFVDRGEHVLKGIDGPQRVWSVVASRDVERARA